MFKIPTIETLNEYIAHIIAFVSQLSLWHIFLLTTLIYFSVLGLFARIQKREKFGSKFRQLIFSAPNLLLTITILFSFVAIVDYLSYTIQINTSNAQENQTKYTNIITKRYKQRVIVELAKGNTHCENIAKNVLQSIDNKSLTQDLVVFCQQQKKSITEDKAKQENNTNQTSLPQESNLATPKINHEELLALYELLEHDINQLDADKVIKFKFLDQLSNSYTVILSVILGFLAIMYLIRIENDRLGNERKHYREQAKDNLKDILKYSLTLMEEIDRHHIDFMYTKHELDDAGCFINLKKLTPNSRTTDPKYLTFKNLYSGKLDDTSNTYYSIRFIRKLILCLYLPNNDQRSAEVCTELATKHQNIEGRLKAVFGGFKPNKANIRTPTDKLEMLYFATCSRNIDEYIKESSKETLNSISNIKDIVERIEKIILEKDFDLNCEYKEIIRNFLNLKRNGLEISHIIDNAYDGSFSFLYSKNEQSEDSLDYFKSSKPVNENTKKISIVNNQSGAEEADSDIKKDKNIGKSTHEDRPDNYSVGSRLQTEEDESSKSTNENIKRWGIIDSQSSTKDDISGIKKDKGIDKSTHEDRPDNYSVGSGLQTEEDENSNSTNENTQFSFEKPHSFINSSSNESIAVHAIENDSGSINDKREGINTPSGTNKGAAKKDLGEQGKKSKISRDFIESFSFFLRSKSKSDDLFLNSCSLALFTNDKFIHDTYQESFLLFMHILKKINFNLSMFLEKIAKKKNAADNLNAFEEIIKLWDHTIYRNEVYFDFYLDIKAMYQKLSDNRQKNNHVNVISDNDIYPWYTKVSSDTDHTSKKLDIPYNKRFIEDLADDVFEHNAKLIIRFIESDKFNYNNNLKELLERLREYETNKNHTYYLFLRVLLKRVTKIYLADNKGIYGEVEALIKLTSHKDKSKNKHLNKLIKPYLISENTIKTK